MKMSEDYLLGVQEAWIVVNSLIKKGELSEPAHSERNGMVLAANAIFDLKQKASEEAA